MEKKNGNNTNKPTSSSNTVDSLGTVDRKTSKKRTKNTNKNYKNFVYDCV